MGSRRPSAVGPPTAGTVRVFRAIGATITVAVGGILTGSDVLPSFSLFLVGLCHSLKSNQGGTRRLVPQAQGGNSCRFRRGFGIGVAY